MTFGGMGTDHRADMANMFDEHAAIYGSIAGAAAYPDDVQRACREAQAQLHRIRHGLLPRTGPDLAEGNVAQWPDGTKRKIFDGELDEAKAAGAVFVCEYAHEDLDFSYFCGSQWCRCF